MPPLEHLHATFYYYRPTILFCEIQQKMVEDGKFYVLNLYLSSHLRVIPLDILWRGKAESTTLLQGVEWGD